MIIGVDIGGTKTLVGRFEGESSDLIDEVELATHKDYQTFIELLAREIQKQLEKANPPVVQSDIELNIALPAKLDRINGVALEFGNLDWEYVPIAEDLRQRIGRQVHIRLENDAKAACLFEASQRPEISKLLYATFSTGIGIGMCVDGHLNQAAEDAEAGFLQLPSPDTNQIMAWEKFASGKAFYERTGKMAKDIDDPNTWQDQAQRMAVGLQHVSAILQPDAIVFGGSVGMQFNKFESPLRTALSDMIKESRMVDLPQLLPAKEPRRAVILGTRLME